VGSILTLFARNFAMTAAGVVVWAVVGFVVGEVLAGAREPSAAKYVWTRKGGVTTSSLERYYDLRDGAVHVCALCGLFGAQAVFLVYHFAQPHSAPTPPPGGFPVKEL
jgi:hypothetical protein